MTTATPETNLMRCWSLIQDTAVQEYDPVSKNSGLLFKNHRTSDFAFICAEDIAAIKAALAVKAEPINGIHATLRHDEGAVARCSYCGRYSLDHSTLGDSHRQPACDCGEKHGWCGSFKKPERDATWSGEAPKPSALAASPPPAVEPVAVPDGFSRNEIEDMLSIYADEEQTVDNGEYRQESTAGWLTRLFRTMLATPYTDLREENERLEAERAEQWRLRREMEASRDMERALAATLSAENERLREALTEIASSWAAHGYSDAMDAVQAMKEAATEALNAER